MPAPDLITVQDTGIAAYQEIVTYQPTGILDINGNLMTDQDIGFLLRVILSELHAIRKVLEANELDVF